MVLAVLTWVNVWNDFLWPLLMIQRNSLATLTLGLVRMRGEYVARWPVIMATSMLIMVPLVIIYAIAQRSFVRGIAVTGIERVTMASVSFEQATRRYPGTDRPALDRLDLAVGDGEFVVLVGPSGCGKTTSLRMVAGLETVDSGRIRIGDRDVTNVDPKDRDVAMVFQNYALYPHMTVAQNMGFALKIAKTPKAEIRERVLAAAKLLDLQPYLDRKPKDLSGGQRQRVAMGRAIVRRPQVFLMDEPLSNLDAKLRVQTRNQIAALQRRLGTTTVYVTHDQVEAMTMGDRVAVLRDGVLQQCATPRELYRNPDNVFVAGFIGSPAMNLFTLPIVGFLGVAGGLADPGAARDRRRRNRGRRRGPSRTLRAGRPRRRNGSRRGRRARGGRLPVWPNHRFRQGDRSTRRCARRRSQPAARRAAGCVCTRNPDTCTSSGSTGNGSHEYGRASTWCARAVGSGDRAGRGGGRAGRGRLSSFPGSRGRARGDRRVAGCRCAGGR